MKIEPQSVDQIAAGAKLAPASTMIILTRLEMKGMVREASPGYYIRKL